MTEATSILPMVLDTDTYNEVDDQFALAYALLSPERLKVEAVCAAPFLNRRVSTPEEGMEKSLREIHKIMELAGRSAPVYEGARAFGPAEGELSPAAKSIIRLALRQREGPLYVVCIASPVNVAHALCHAPEIRQRITVVWLGGHSYGHPDTNEFNLKEDLWATRTLLDSGVSLVHIPCLGVASQLWTSLAELEKWLGGKNALCDGLIDLFRSYRPDHFAWGKVLWDVAAVARLINPEWVPCASRPSPLVTDDLHWAFDPRRPLIQQAYACQRNLIFGDLFERLMNAE